MNRYSNPFFAALVAAALSACGGGDASTPATGSTAARGSWTMGPFTYHSEGGDLYQSTTSTGQPYNTITLVDTQSPHGAYQGGGLALTFSDTVSGTYTVVPDATMLVATTPGQKIIHVSGHVGLHAATPGSAVYTAQSGQVQLTRDASGAFHFSTRNKLPMLKTLDGSPVKIEGSPQTMEMTIADAH